MPPCLKEAARQRSNLVFEDIVRIGTARRIAAVAQYEGRLVIVVRGKRNKEIFGIQILAVFQMDAAQTTHRLPPVQNEISAADPARQMLRRNSFFEALPDSAMAGHIRDRAAHHTTAIARGILAR